MKRQSRRRFLSAMTAAGAVAAVGDAVTASGASTPNDRIAVGLIGFNSMGMHHIRQTASNSGARAVALCDVNDAVLAR